MAKFQFSAQARSESGSASSRRLRREAKLPGIIYGGGATPQSIIMSHHEMLQLLRKEDFQSSIIEMNLDGNSHQVLLRDVQLHPYKQKLVHLDFQRVSGKEEIYMSVPLRFIGAEESPGVKTQKGIASHTLIEIEVSCLPKDLPTHIDVDMSALEVGETIHARQLKMPTGVNVVLAKDEDPLVCSIMAPMKEEVETTSTAAVLDAAAATAEAKTEDKAEKK